MGPIGGDGNQGFYYSDMQPSYYPDYSYRKPHFIDSDFSYIANYPDVDFDQQYMSSQENFTPSTSDDIFDINSYSSPVLEHSLSSNSMFSQNRRIPHMSSRVKNYIERGFDNENFDDKDEGLLLGLAAKYKNDWKKISKRMFRLHNKKFGLNFLRLRYKELTDGRVKKRVRFTHREDLMIAKYSSLYGHDWTKIAFYFSNRTPIMLKNRYYHMRKKGIFDKLVKEVECLENENVDVAKFEEDKNEIAQIFSHDDEDLAAKKASLPPMNLDMSNLSTDVQYSEAVTPERESQRLDNIDPYIQPQGYNGSSIEEPLNYVDNVTNELPPTINQAPMDWMSNSEINF